jgi:hypothetical protein
MGGIKMLLSEAKKDLELANKKLEDLRVSL